MHLSTLAEFSAICEEALDAEQANQMPSLSIGLLPVELSPIFKPGSLSVFGLPNVDGEDFLKEHFTAGRTERMALGVDSRLGIEAQVQAILRMAIHVVSRSTTFAAQNVHNVDVMQLTNAQQQSDASADDYAKKIISSLGSANIGGVLADLFTHLGTTIRFNLRSRLFADDSIRRSRYEIYDRIYARYPFVRQVVDNLVASTTGRDFKFVNPILEVPSDPMMNKLIEFTLSSQMHKLLNHWNRDACLYGDGFARRFAFYDELSLILIKPHRVTLSQGGYSVESDQGELTISRGDIMHAQFRQWDTSGFGVSEIEPLVGQYLKIAHEENLLSQLELLFNRTLILDQQIKINKLIRVAKESISQLEEGMKTVLIEPAQGSSKPTSDLYLC